MQRKDYQRIISNTKKNTNTAHQTCLPFLFLFSPSAIYWSLISYTFLKATAT